MVPGTIDPAIGLCSDCKHCRIVKSERAAFHMCRLSFTNPEYRKYPPLPVVRCPGYQPLVPSEVEGAALSEVAGPDDKLTE